MQTNLRWLHGSARLLLAGLALGLSLPRPAAADWLVTREGGRVETHGPWQVKGKVVVFTTAGGALSSLRLDQVDLPASQKLTADKLKKVEAEAARPAEKKKPVRTITDKDVAHPTAAAAPAPSGPAGDAAAKGDDKAGAKDKEKAKGDAPATKEKSSQVAVGSWQRLDRPQNDGVDISGELKNSSAAIAGEVSLTVTLLDETGAVVKTAPATLANTSIQPQGSVTFRAAFPGVFAFASAKFDVKSLPLRVPPPVDKGKSQ